MVRWLGLRLCCRKQYIRAIMQYLSMLREVIGLWATYFMIANAVFA